ncbi:hypothetical protein M2651_09790 [Clostridium sp. SYSU_GA19001]|uniref:hypothetical protein n=1 Tax=Clostridium caldaquaticum TaxID=2940653 RepID=UPI00207713B4|nr:hypothetical protein [Clostridium caldaquaticum]MCM8711322.1 hypothetical protein [Clostridium caldaquaticum]
MTMTSHSLSYLFLGVTVISFIFFFYFKVLVSNTSEKSSKKEKIIGNMKNPSEWRSKNNRMSYVFLFWFLASLIIFIYLKFFYGLGLISGIYVIAYLALIVISAFVAGIRRKSTL